MLEAGRAAAQRSEGKSIKQLQVLKRHTYHTHTHTLEANEAQAIIICGIGLLIGRLADETGGGRTSASYFTAELEITKRIKYSCNIAGDKRNPPPAT